MTPRDTCRAGFTLLEALVALVLIASTGMAVYGWINSSLMTLVRVEEHALQDTMVRNALTYVETVNPMASPSGKTTIGPYTVSWESSVVEPERDGAGHPLGVSVFRVGLYNVHVTVWSDHGGEAQFDVRQVGYRQERFPAYDTF